MKPLLPCPFCGSPASLNESSRGFWVCCTGESCDAGNVHDNWTKEGAIEIWNRRDSDTYSRGVVDGYQQCLAEEDNNQAFAYLFGGVKEEDMSPRTLKIAAKMREAYDKGRADSNKCGATIAVK